MSRASVLIPLHSIGQGHVPAVHPPPIPPHRGAAAANCWVVYFSTLPFGHVTLNMPVVSVTSFHVFFLRDTVQVVVVTKDVSSVEIATGPAKHVFPFELFVITWPSITLTPPVCTGGPNSKTKVAPLAQQLVVVEESNPRCSSVMHVPFALKHW